MGARFADQVALVTGGGGGLGRVVAQRLAAEGARVVVADRDEAAARAVAAGLPAGLAVAVDIGDAAGVAAMVERARRHFGGIDLLVNNAAITGNHPDYRRYSLLDTPLDFWRWLLEINLTGQLACLQAVGRLMAARGGGAIVNVGSIAGLLPTPGDVAYSVGKAAVVMLTQCAAAELGAAGIRVNAVAPAGMHRPSPDRPRPTAARNPLGRVAEYEDVADVIVFLCSREARFVAGQVVTVDGGESVALRYRHGEPRTDTSSRG